MLDFPGRENGMWNRCLSCLCMQSKEKDAHSNVNNKRICKDGPVFLVRRWKSDGYESKYCRSRVEESGDSCIRNIWFRRRIH